MLFFRRRGPTFVRRNVSEDWIASLPRDKSLLFDREVHEWECAHAMMSVALDDAITLRERGELVCAREQAGMAAELVSRLADILAAACHTISEFARQIPELPQVDPLNSSFFLGVAARDAASWNSLLHYVLFGSRSRFFHKLRILASTVDKIDQEFERTADSIAGGFSTRPTASWNDLCCLQYDMSTCLREVEVVFKSFLRTSAPEQLGALAERLRLPPAPLRERTRSRPIQMPAARRHIAGLNQ